MFKNQVFSTYLYQNHNDISTYICNFLKKLPQISIIMIPGYLVFSTCLYQITLVYSPMSCIFLKSTSNLRYNDKKKSVKV